MRHRLVVVATVEIDTVPRVPVSERVLVDDLGIEHDGITQVTIRFGYTETPDVPLALATLEPEQTEGRLELDDATYFLSKIELRPGQTPGLAPWRKRLFVATSHVTADAAEYFGLPRERTVLMGSQIEV